MHVFAFRPCFCSKMHFDADMLARLLRLQAFVTSQHRSVCAFAPVTTQQRLFCKNGHRHLVLSCQSCGRCNDTCQTGHDAHQEGNSHLCIHSSLCTRKLLLYAIQVLEEGSFATLDCSLLLPVHELLIISLQERCYLLGKSGLHCIATTGGCTPWLYCRLIQQWWHICRHLHPNQQSVLQDVTKKCTSSFSRLAFNCSSKSSASLLMSACTTVQQGLSGCVTSRPGTEICKYKWSQDSIRNEFSQYMCRYSSVGQSCTAHRCAVECQIGPIPSKPAELINLIFSLAHRRLPDYISHSNRLLACMINYHLT